MDKQGDEGHAALAAAQVAPSPNTKTDESVDEQVDHGHAAMAAAQVEIDDGRECFFPGIIFSFASSQQ